MKRFFKDHLPKRHARSFKYAFSGLFHALVNEPNFRVQLIIITLFVFFGFKYHISNVEWGLLVVSTGLLLSAEMVNTVVENFIDSLINDDDDGAKIIKDLSAGFVLIAAITTLIVFYLIFWKYFMGISI